MDLVSLERIGPCNPQIHALASVPFTTAHVLPQSLHYSLDPGQAWPYIRNYSATACPLFQQISYLPILVTKKGIFFKVHGLPNNFLPPRS